HESALAVSTFMDANSDSLEVYVSHSLGVLDQSEYEPIKDATVELYRNGDLLHVFTGADDQGTYKVKEIEPLGGDAATYRLEVAASKYESVSAEQVMPAAPIIDRLEYVEDGALTEDGEKADELRIFISDPAGIENYYAFNIRFDYANGSGGSGYYSNDLFLEYGTTWDMLRDATFDGQQYVLKYLILNYGGEALQPGDRVIVESLSITEDSYLHERSKNIYWEGTDNPFVEPVVVHENIDRGHGIFSVSNSTTKEVVF
ncbi:MAG: DUF4249 domain-containing protein, partial [Bacteroidota bacterium]